MKLRVHSPDDLVAALPHLLGFTPVESVVLVPFGRGLPLARVDLPRTDEERTEMLAALSGPYLRHAIPGSMLGVVCVSEDRANSKLASQDIAEAFTPAVSVPLQHGSPRTGGPS